MTSNRENLANYLDNWPEPIKPCQLADVLGLSLATIRAYKSRMDLDPITCSNLLPKPLPSVGKRVLYTKASILEWWLTRSEPVKQQGRKRGRPSKSEQLARAIR